MRAREVGKHALTATWRCVRSQEVQFLSFLQRSRMRAEMAAEREARNEKERQKMEAIKSGGEMPSDDTGDNFYQLLQEARDILPDNSWWVQ